MPISQPYKVARRRVSALSIAQKKGTKANQARGNNSGFRKGAASKAADDIVANIFLDISSVRIVFDQSGLPQPPRARRTDERNMTEDERNHCAVKAATLVPDQSAAKSFSGIRADQDRYKIISLQL